MTGADVRISRIPGLRVLPYVAVAIATLAGLFAMHGLPMTMPTTTAMPSAVAVACNSAGASGMSGTSVGMATGDPVSAAHVRAVTAHDGHAGTASVASPMSVSPVCVSPMAGVHGGCDADHDGCLATLRGQPHSVAPSAITLALAGADPASSSGIPTRAGLLRRGAPVSRPCLTELCISRT